MSDKERLIKLLAELRCLGGLERQIADHLIANGVAVGKDTNILANWISVEERLPENGERVLATPGGAVFEAFLDNSGRWLRGGIDMDRWYGKVTHWMPLPAPPKEDA